MLPKKEEMFIIHEASECFFSGFRVRVHLKMFFEQPMFSAVPCAYLASVLAEVEFSFSEKLFLGVLSEQKQPGVIVGVRCVMCEDRQWLS